MAYDKQSEGSKALDQIEHNIDASSKRVVLRYQDPVSGDWLNQVPSKVGGVDYDYIDVQQTSATVDTYIFKTGGAGGTTVQTIVLTFTDANKTDIDSVAWT